MRRVGSVNHLQLLLEAPCAQPGSTHTVRFFPGGHHHGDGGCDCERIDVALVAGREYEGLFYGALDLTEHGPLGPIRGERPALLGCVEIPDEVGEICDAYVVLGYCADRPRGCGAGTDCPCDTRCACPGRACGDGHDRP
jgi:hypothetical protein